jgi:hypothetical protein
MGYWFENNKTVNMGFLIKFNECPQYRSPKRGAATRTSDPWSVGPTQYELGNMEEDDEGRIMIGDSEFVGHMSTFLEIWIRETTTRKRVCRERIVSIYPDPSSQKKN